MNFFLGGVVNRPCRLILPVADTLYAKGRWRSQQLLVICKGAGDRDGFWRHEQDALEGMNLERASTSLDPRRKSKMSASIHAVGLRRSRGARVVSAGGQPVN